MIKSPNTPQDRILWNEIIEDTRRERGYYSRGDARRRRYSKRQTARRRRRSEFFQIHHALQEHLETDNHFYDAWAQDARELANSKDLRKTRWISARERHLSTRRFSLLNTADTTRNAQLQPAIASYRMQEAHYLINCCQAAVKQRKRPPRMSIDEILVQYADEKDTVPGSPKLTKLGLAVGQPHPRAWKRERRRKRDRARDKRGRSRTRV